MADEETPTIAEELAGLPGRLTFARELAGLHLKELSLLAGLAQGHAGMVERGEMESPSIRTVALLAEVLGLSMDWIVLGRGKVPTARSVIAAVARFRAEQQEAA